MIPRSRSIPASAFAGVHVSTKSRLVLALLLLPLAGAFAQSTSRSGTSPSTATKNADGPDSEKKEDETLQLSEFEVRVDSDKSYGALNSNSITKFNVEMDKLPVSANIFTETFMKDVGATSVESVVQAYSAGAGFNSGNGDSSGTTAANQPGDRSANAYTQLRGMNTPTMQRDGFMPVGTFGNPGSTGVNVTSNFDIERVEVVNGPQALLYGGGGAGGVINVTSKQARFSRSPFGEILYRVNQYGGKLGQMDFGIGTEKLAVRVAFLEQSDSGRRVNIGGATHGAYGQIAWRPFKNTTVRLLTQQTTFNRILASGNVALTAPVADPRNGLSLHYLLATNQAGATDPVTGAAYPAGPLVNGRLNWDNVDSFGGNVIQDPVRNDYSSLTVETKWTDSITSLFAVGYDDFQEKRLSNGLTFYAPGGSGNSLGGWAVSQSPGLWSWQPARTKAIRAAVLSTNDFFNGKAHSQSLLGWDFIRTDMAQMQYNYYLADNNFSPIVSATGVRTTLPRQFWSINNGVNAYPLGFNTNTNNIQAGANYAAALSNPIDPSLISPANPLGTSATGNYILTKIFNKGLYGVNYTQWFDGRINTIAGIRLNDTISDRMNQSGGLVRFLSKAKTTNFNVGVEYTATDWFHPYISASDSSQPPYLANNTDPYNNAPVVSHGLGGEAGFKISMAEKLSGSVAFFYNSAKNDLYGIQSTISREIDPAGLTGGGGGNTINIDRVTKGMEVTVTAAPTRNWRMRFSASVQDGKVGTTRIYDQVYNDQFYANSSGQITYKDGTPVYVNPSVTAVSPTAPTVTATTPGAVPLTIAMISTQPTVANPNPYWANPEPVSGAINSGSGAGIVLKSIDPVHGAILTGATNLPITQLQLNTSLAGISVPGSILATRVGDKTTGYPGLSFNFTNLYTFSRGWLNGFAIGGTAAVSWDNRGYYYYTDTITPTSKRALFNTPVQEQFNLISAYTRKFRRVTFKSQLNIDNMFNHYSVQILPGATTGYNNLKNLNATFFQQPRVYTWSNTVSF